MMGVAWASVLAAELAWALVAESVWALVLVAAELASVLPLARR
jgi:hypothetical protein